MSWKSVVSVVGVCALVCGCASTKQARTVERYGFLAGIYPLMRKGQEGEPIQVYQNPTANRFGSDYFTKILLDPVLVYRGQDVRMQGVTQEEAQLAANTFYAMIHDNLSKDYEMVSGPGPNTLRIQIALVRLGESQPGLDVVSSVPLPYNVVGMSSALVGLSSGKQLFKGEVAIEMKVSDGKTGELLYAGIDRRVGGSALNAEMFDSWSDVDRAFKYWAELTRYRLCQSRGDADCVLPEE